jgi:hypothetical protein
MLCESDLVKKQILNQNLEVHGIRNATLMRRKIGSISEAESTAAAGEGGKPMQETLDDLQLERLDWLKINGAKRALEMLARAEVTIWRLRRRILIAGHGRNVDAAELGRPLQDLGFTSTIIEIPQYNPANYGYRESSVFEDVARIALLAVP